MRLEKGATLAHYEIVSKIGAGGMGEVFKAHDSRLDREVAIKVLPSELSSDEDRLRRFEQEAKATSALNHPNILTVYDIGEHDGSPFIVSELLEGEELRERLEEGPIPLRKVTEYAQQIVSGLTAAHEKGIVHRDLKPENLFITNDDRVKILDFGLAKLRAPETNIHGSEDATRRAITSPGVVMGTVGYMSPEQVRGASTDHRSDIFSFGTILHEMITGRRAFQHETMAETMSAILKEEPEELTESNPNISPSLERIVRRCLEKKPERRFQTASDLGFALESLSATSISSRTSMSEIAAESETVKRRRIPLLIAGVLILALIGAGLWYFGRRFLTPSAASVADVTYKTLSFEKGFIFAARFAPDGRTIIYSADWDRQPRGIFVTNLDNLEYRPLGFPGADLLGVSSSGELAILSGSTIDTGSPYWRTGTLARASLTGGASRPELEGVRFADFGANNTMAIVRVDEGRWVVEFPVGQKLNVRNGGVDQEVSGNATYLTPRVSPSGDHVAFFENRSNIEKVLVFDRSGKFITSSQPFSDWWSLAWKSPDEVWFAATEASGATNIYSLDLAGRQRLVYRASENITLHDISPQGEVLVSFDRGSSGIEILEGADAQPRDRSVRSNTFVAFSADHTILLSGNGVGQSVVYAYKPNDTQPVKIADGRGLALSPDGTKALVASAQSPITMSIVPTGVGRPQAVDIGPIDALDWAGWLPDGRIIVQATRSGSGSVVYMLSAAGRDPVQLLPEEITLPSSRRNTGNNLISPDGGRIIALDAAGKFVVCTIAAPVCRPLAGVQDSDTVSGWTPDGQGIHFFQNQPGQTQIDRLDVASGKRTAWKTIHPLNPSASGIVNLIVAPDGAIAYGYRKDDSQLCVIKGLK
ncbi:MAG: protein kinase [Acidobacteriota bacterium]